MIGIVYIVEKGVLEQQAILLQRSIEKFISPLTPVKSFAYCVRGNHKPSIATIQSLEEHGATYVFDNLNKRYDYFPLCNGIHAASQLEQEAVNISGCLLLDTDTVFINPIETDLFDQNEILIRPVDNKGIGSEGNKDSNDSFWQAAYGLFNIKPPKPKMLTTISRIKIRPYYNSGFIYAKQETGFFNQWKLDFEKLMESDVRTNKDTSRYKIDYGFIEQMSISITLNRIGAAVTVPKVVYNYPLPFKPKLQTQEVSKYSLSDLVHVHYHKWFQHPGFLDHITSDEEKQSEQYKWLKKHLPLQPEIDGPFKC